MTQVAKEMLKPKNPGVSIFRDREMGTRRIVRIPPRIGDRKNRHRHPEARP
jgi:hypothetical protein